MPGHPVKDLPEIVRNEIRYVENRMQERLTRAVILNKDKGTVFVESDQPIRKVSVEDELAIKEIINNGYAYQFSKLVKSKPVLKADSLYVSQFIPGELIDYYNTYKGDKTYQLEDVIKALPTPAKK